MDYISVEHQKALAQRYRLACIVVTAFMVSVLVYLLMARIVTPENPIPGSETWAQPIYSGIIVLGLLVVVCRRLLLSQMVMRPAASRGGVIAVLANLFTMTIVVAVAAELAALVGLVFYFLTGDYQYSWRLGVVSLFLLAYSFPRRGEWERAVVASTKAQA